MSNLLPRLKKRYKITVEAWKKDCTYSRKYACYRVIDEFGGRLGFQTISNIAYKKREKFILDYLETELQPVIAKYRNNDTLGQKTEKAPIWICWWLGIDIAPALVKQCVKSIIKSAGEHPVHLITKNSYEKYLSIPEYMLQKVQKKQMGFAHLADYIRVSLLEQYGGLWMDATLFCTDTIPEEYFDIPFFTLKSAWRESRYLSHFQWVTFCLGGWKGSVWYSFMREAFEAYWSKEEYAIDYLFFDALIFLARKNIPAIARLIESVPENTPHRDDLQAAMNQALPASEFWNVIQENTTIYKLSWREEYPTKTVKGQQSAYQYFLDLDLGDGLW